MRQGINYSNIHVTFKIIFPLFFPILQKASTYVQNVLWCEHSMQYNFNTF